jgi:DNA topoisomerase IB
MTARRGRLRRVDCSDPGITRVRRGKGFSYVDISGDPVSQKDVERIAELAIPPAWKDVWICTDPLGHIQATGVDARGRKQYRYHDRWRERRDREKFESMVGFGKALPKLRERVRKDLRRRKLSRERVLAGAVRLLDLGFFRIGGEDYAVENETYGVATMRRRHVSVDGDTVTFDYEAKGNRRRVQTIGDPALARLVRELTDRRGGGHELLAYRDDGDGGWADVRSDDINAYVKEASGGDHTAKDFRTWNATVLAAVALAGQARNEKVDTTAARTRGKNRAVKEVARLLGNTPAVCRRSYIDPQVFDRFDGGLTIAGAFDRLPENPADWPEIQGPIEQAVLDLLERRRTKAIERHKRS